MDQHRTKLKLIADGIRSPTDKDAKQWIEMLECSLPPENSWKSTYPKDKDLKDLIEASDAFKKMMECVRAGMHEIDVAWMVVVQFLMYENEGFKAKCSSKMFEGSDDTILSLAIDRAIHSDSNEVRCVAMNTVCCSIIECSRRKSPNNLDPNRTYLSTRKDFLSSVCDHVASNIESVSTTAIDCIMEISTYNACVVIGLGILDKVTAFLDPDHISNRMSTTLDLIITLLKNDHEVTLEAAYNNKTLVSRVIALTKLSSNRKTVVSIKKRAAYLKKTFRAKENADNLEAARAMTSIQRRLPSGQRRQEGAAICPIVISDDEYSNDEEITPMAAPPEGRLCQSWPEGPAADATLRPDASGHKRMFEDLRERIVILEQEKKDMRDRHNEITRTVQEKDAAITAKLEETTKALEEERKKSKEALEEMRLHKEISTSLLKNHASLLKNQEMMTKNIVTKLIEFSQKNKTATGAASASAAAAAAAAGTSNQS
jgi:hypothetical protein